jgi:hypothetical protein
MNIMLVLAFSCKWFFITQMEMEFKIALVAFWEDDNNNINGIAHKKHGGWKQDIDGNWLLYSKSSAYLSPVLLIYIGNAVKGLFFSFFFFYSFWLFSLNHADKLLISLEVDLFPDSLIIFGKVHPGNGCVCSTRVWARYHFSNSNLWIFLNIF